MAYRSLEMALLDLERHGQLLRVKEEVDPYLQMAAIHRRVYQAGGPALLYERVKGSPFPAASNLFGSLERARFLFRHTLKRVKAMIHLRANPPAALKNPLQALQALQAGLFALPLPALRPAVLRYRAKIEDLPQIVSWPRDGGPFITLPQVYSENVDQPGLLSSNLGMYRIQIGGNRYRPGRQIGLHYQIERGIGQHHSAALAQGVPLKVTIFVGGPPAHTLAAVMPLPSGLPEILFAGGLAGRHFRYLRKEGYLISADADFCITGTVEDFTLPEGPFGDHLGYYSLQHPFPLLRVEALYHRRHAIWPFTVVGRPPQEDSIFGALIHELTEPMVSVSIPGVHSMHAVDAAGVHPLMLAIGSERYQPYTSRRPRELLTVANAILGFGQASLAKYLFISARQDDPTLNVYNISAYFDHFLRRVDWRYDLHFQTCTTMDTLDYSGGALNKGSRVVAAAAGQPIRTLARQLPRSPLLPAIFRGLRLALPGIALLEGPRFHSYRKAKMELKQLDRLIEKHLRHWNGIALIVIVDDSHFTARNLNNFLWVTFTRSNPSHDIWGAAAFSEYKHWGCHGPLFIDARIKPHHAPPLEEDPVVERSVDALAAAGKSLHKVI